MVWALRSSYAMSLDAQYDSQVEKYVEYFQK